MKRELVSAMKLTLSVPETAVILGVSNKTAYALVKRADFPSFRISPNRVVVSRAGLERWIEDRLAAKEGH